MPETDVVLRFSNQELVHTVANDTALEAFYAMQNQRLAVCIRSLMASVGLNS